jgi:hypothetical protein
MFIDEHKHRGVSPTAIKSRTAVLQPLEALDDMEVLQRHSRDMAHFIAFSNKIRELNSVFGNAEVVATISEYFPDVEQDIARFIQTIANNNRQMSDKMDATIEQFRRNFVTAKLGLKPSLMIKQMLSIPAYAETISATDFTRGLVEFMSNPQEAINTLNKSNLMKLRGDEFSFELQNISKGRGRKVKKAIAASMLPIKIGDRTAIYVGGWTVYSAAIRKGKTKAEALAEFERVTARTQQSTDVEQLTSFQTSGSFKKILTTFLSTPIQYFNREMWALRNLKSGKITPQEATKIIAIYHFILPMIFQYVSDGFEWEDENQARAAAMGSLNGWLIVNDAISNMIKGATNVGYYEGRQELYNFVDDMVGGAKAAESGNFYDATRDMATSMGAVTGIPLQRGFDIYEAGEKISEGKVEQGIYQALGFPKSVVENK